MKILDKIPFFIKKLLILQILHKKMHGISRFFCGYILK